MKAWRWLKDYWVVPFLALGAIFAVLLWTHNRHSGPKPFQKLRKKLDVIDAKRRTRDEAIRDGAEATKKRVKERYRKTLETLDKKADAQVRELENGDPEELAALLESLTR